MKEQEQQPQRKTSECYLLVVMTQDLTGPSWGLDLGPLIPAEPTTPPPCPPSPGRAPGRGLPPSTVPRRQTTPYQTTQHSMILATQAVQSKAPAAPHQGGQVLDGGQVLPAVTLGLP